jgi:hypothetical protein
MIAAHSTKQFQENSFAFNIKKKTKYLHKMKANHILEKKNHCADNIQRGRAKNREGRKRITTMHKHSISLAYRGRRDLNDERYHSLILAYANVA